MNSVGIRLEGISKHFEHQVKGQVYAVRDVSLTVEPDEFVTLLGPSGCGKTTTLRMIAGFEEPDQGRISFGDRDVTDLMANQRDIGFVFQNYALFPHLSVHENVSYGLRVKKQSDSMITHAVGEVLELVGLEGFDRQFPHQLSGGEQQRVALARAIVIRPRVLLFDEPLSNLDAKLRVQMRGEIQRLQKTLAITTIYVTHDQEEAMAISDRIAVMNQGAIVQEGSAETLYHRPASEFVAQFIGRTNLLKGKVMSVNSGKVDLDIQGWRLDVATERTDLAPSASVQVVVRPEAIELHPLSAGDGLKGTILSRVFLGEKVEYQVRMGSEVLEVVDYRLTHTKGMSPGDEVRIDFPTDRVQLLPGGSP